MVEAWREKSGYCPAECHLRRCASTGGIECEIHEEVVYSDDRVSNGKRLLCLYEHALDHTETSQHQHFMREIDFQGVILYLRVFYHGMEVKLLPIDLAFTSWEDSPRPKVKSKSKTKTKAGKERAFGAVALSTGTEAIRIRFRSTPPPNSDSQKDVFPYSHQLDLNDMVDVALGVLPPDAYALLLLTDHDMYESEDDDFCCGRAWGASRVAVVSGARYQPSLDSLHGVDEAHVWPASHCRDYVDSMSNVHSDREMGGRQHGNKKRMVADGPQPAGQNGISALARAIEAHWTTFVPGSHWNGPPNFFLRICRTASHELGHCFGLDHCMYKACMMQGTASVAEDIRQPPYLCPVCEAKIAWALADEYPLISNSGSKGSTHREIRGETAAPSGGSRSQTALQRWKQDRHAALKHFCEFHSSSFSPLLAWSNAFLEPTQDLGSENEKLDL